MFNCFADIFQDLNKIGVPTRCIVIADTLPLVLLWLNFVSSVGYQAIVSQVTLALTVSYFLVFACALDTRLYRPQVLGYNHGGFWQPGRRLGVMLDLVDRTCKLPDQVAQGKAGLTSSFLKCTPGRADLRIS